MWEKVTVSEIENQMQVIRENGFNCNYLGFDMKFVLEMIFSLAEQFLFEDEKEYLMPLKELSLNFKAPKHSTNAEVAIL